MTDKNYVLNNHECNSPSMVEADQINRDNTIGKDANNQQSADIRADQNQDNVLANVAAQDSEHRANIHAEMEQQGAIKREYYTVTLVSTKRFSHFNLLTDCNLTPQNR